MRNTFNGKNTVHLIYHINTIKIEIIPNSQLISKIFFSPGFVINTELNNNNKIIMINFQTGTTSIFSTVLFFSPRKENSLYTFISPFL